MYRVLIADDMVPDSSLTSEQEVREYYSRLYPGTDFAEGCAFLYRLLNLLRNEGYIPELADIPSDALRLAASESYDVIVLDLGWWTLRDISPDEKMVLGFRMADEIRKKSRAPILMFSNRFAPRRDSCQNGCGEGLFACV